MAEQPDRNPNRRTPLVFARFIIEKPRWATEFGEGVVRIKQCLASHPGTINSAHEAICDAAGVGKTEYNEHSNCDRDSKGDVYHALHHSTYRFVAA
jgi:hypothetical protein